MGGIWYLADFVLVRLGSPCLPKGDSAQVSPDALWLSLGVHPWVLGAGGQSQGCIQVLSHCPIQGMVALPRLP